MCLYICTIKRRRRRSKEEEEEERAACGRKSRPKFILLCSPPFREFEAMKNIPMNPKPHIAVTGPPLWSSGQSPWPQIQKSRVGFPALSDFLSSSGSGTGPTQPDEDN
jgi:hypothetical protein